MDVLIIGVLLIWVIGSFVRVYKQARFYQIEEYKSNRYLHWWLAERERFLHRRTLIATFVGAVLAFFLSESPDSPLPVIIAGIASGIAVFPPDEGEIKKKFIRTQRATRLLGASFGVTIFDTLLYFGFMSLFDIEETELRVISVMLIGLIIYLTVPLQLMLGNILMTPVERFLRQRFISSAKQVMESLNPKVIGITGSYGKTTTKNFITHILNGRYHAYATPKSYNTMMGVCIAINNDLANDYSVDYFIVEMGAYVEGEIAQICGLTPPSISVMVEVGAQHLERFGSLENTAKAKYEIIKALPEDGVAVFNVDNAYIREMNERDYPQTRLSVSRENYSDKSSADDARFVATDIQESLDGLSFTVTDNQTQQQERFTTPVIGEHNVTNILLAAAVAVYEGMSLKDVAFRVRTLQPAESRLVSHTTPQGITIINDAYSANPLGVVSSLKVLGMYTQGRRLLITPGMVELGDLQDAENYKLGQLIAQYATDVILVGEAQTHAVKAGLLESAFPNEHLQVVDALSDSIQWYQHNLKSGDTVLFLNDLPDTY